jgi:hypothetical protein
MSDETIKQRQRRARVRALKNLQSAGYGIINPPDIVAIRDSEARFIRVIIGRPKAEDIKRCRADHIREIWSVDDTGKFEFKHIL